jgi:hypothetical protein
LRADGKELRWYAREMEKKNVVSLYDDDNDDDVLQDLQHPS